MNSLRPIVPYLAAVCCALPASASADRINRDLTATLKSQDVVKQLNARGIDATPSSPAEYLAFICADEKKWVPVIEKADTEA